MSAIRRTSMAALPALLLLLSTARSEAQMPQIERVVGPACIEILAAKTMADVKTIALRHLGPVSEFRRTAEDFLVSRSVNGTLNGATLDPLHKAEAAVKFKQREIDRLEALTLATRKKYDIAKDALEAAIKIEADLKAARLRLAKATPSGPRLLWSKTQTTEFDDAEKAVNGLAEQFAKADKPGWTTRFANLSSELGRAVDAEQKARKELPPLKAEETRTRTAFNTAKVATDKASADIAIADIQVNGIANCAAQSALKIDPQTVAIAAKLDGMLANLESNVVAMEKMKPTTSGFCARLQGALLAAQAATSIEETARQLAANAKSTSAQGATGQAEKQKAAAAAATIGRLRAHATKAANDACKAAGAVTADPAKATAATDLAEARSQRTLAEKDVAEAAAALNDIRAAHATLTGAGAPSPNAALTARLDALRARLRAELGSDELHAVMADVMAVARIDAAAVIAAGKMIGDYEGFAKDALGKPTYEFVAANAREPRFKALEARYLAMLATIQCVQQATAQMATLLERMTAAHNAIDEAAAAVGAVTPAGAAGEIEAIFTKAYADAQAIAAEATRAIGCETTARKAVETASAATPKLPPGAVTTPIPGKPNGLSCRYTKGASYIEFIIYDRPCPPSIEDYTLAGSKPVEVASTTEKDFGDKAADFTGKWIDKREQSWAYTFTNGKASRFPISAETIYAGGDNAKTKWTGFCQRLAINKVECGGTGTFENTLRVQEFKVKAVLFVHDGGILTHDYEFYDGKTVRMKFEGHRPVPFNNGKFKGNPLTKQ